MQPTQPAWGSAEQPPASHRTRAIQGPGPTGALRPGPLGFSRNRGRLASAEKQSIPLVYSYLGIRKKNYSYHLGIKNYSYLGIHKNFLFVALRSRPGGRLGSAELEFIPVASYRNP